MKSGAFHKCKVADYSESSGALHLKSTSFHVLYETPRSHNCAGHCGGNHLFFQFFFVKHPLPVYNVNYPLPVYNVNQCKSIIDSLHM